VVLVGSTHSSATLSARALFSRDGHPYAWADLVRAAGAQEVLDRLGVPADDVPPASAGGR
jgi:thioredoxin reductase (NADPH)